MDTKRARLGLVFALAAAMLCGCNYFGRPTVTLYTDRAELAAYCETFNVSQDEFLVEIAYRSSPIEGMLSREDNPDLIICAGLSDPKLLELFEPLSSLLNDDRIDSKAFYQDLLSLGRREKTQYILPLNFDLPAVVSLRGSFEREDGNLLLALDSMRKLASEYNVIEKEQLRREGFSPLWNEDFLYATALIFNADFRTDGVSSIQWNPEGLAEAIEYLRSWIFEVNVGDESDQAFKEKYMKMPEYRLLEDGRILFYFTDMKSFHRIPQDKREDLEFRWLSRDGKIQVRDNILFAGIPRSGRNKKGARLFLEWIFTPQVQMKIMETNQFKRLAGVFGISNGFSSLSEVNEKALPQPQFYPLFLGHIPSPEMLSFPSRLPYDWHTLKHDLVIPWLRDTIIDPAQTADLADLLSKKQP
jgi:ABC-type glycerol-3-phosphate transport system substrate-binding protein